MTSRGKWTVDYYGRLQTGSSGGEFGRACITDSGRHVVRGTSTITITNLEIYLVLHLSVCSKTHTHTQIKAV